jgi:hypothetical protein
MTNTTKRTARAARNLAKAVLKIKAEDKELGAWLEEDLARSIQRFREIQAGIAAPVAG